MAHPDPVAGHEQARCMPPQPNVSAITYMCVLLSPLPSDSDYEVCEITLQNVTNRCLHHILFLLLLLMHLPFSSHNLSALPRHNFTSSTSPFILSFISLLSYSDPPLPHFSWFSLLPGLHATKEDKVVSILFSFVFFLLSLCAVNVTSVLLQGKGRKCWLRLDLELISILEIWCKTK